MKITKIKNVIIRPKKGVAMFINAVIEKDENGYFAYVPRLDGCVSQGKTYEEAIANITEAAELYLESLSESEMDFITSKNSAIIPIEINLNARIS